MNSAQQWQEQGYLIVRDTFDAERIRRLHETCESVLEQWKQQSTKDSEPANFWYGPKAWILIHLNHPKYYRKHPDWLPVLLNAVADPLVVQILRDVFREEGVVMQINYYIDPPGEGWVGAWHRDCQFYTGVDEATEKRNLFAEADPPRELHLHIPLVKTAATEVVPASHARWDTAEEARIRRTEPLSDKMPGALRIQLAPGDLAFFHVNALHRGLYFHGVPRRTIAVTFSRVSYPRKATAEWMQQWKGYAASYQPWFLKPGYLDGCTDGARSFYERFIEIYRDSWKPEYLTPDLGPERIEYFTKF